ncbi:MAG: polysaccharide deacetylase family protein [Erysipelotrichaceae bacterium]|nr:polysaccharide deacetylase family protein [Erysipelotrichaceae bacterium]
MEKTKSKVRRNSQIRSTILIALLAIGLSCLSIYFYNAYTKANEKLIQNKQVLNVLNETLDKTNVNLDNCNKELNDLKDIDKKIDEIKEIYFKNAVKAEELARSGEADFKVCYLTFDDGPYSKTTPAFLDVLEKYDVQATFFCLAKEGVDDIYKREKMNCHTIGNHTASHNIKYIYSSVDVFINDLLENRKFIEDLLGITTDVMRFPGGSPQVSYSGLSTNQMIEKLRENHYGYVDWTLTTGDGGGPTYLTPDEFLHNVIDSSPNFNVISVLMHDYSTNTLACLSQMIEELTNQGYIFLPLSYDAPIVRK